MPIRRAHSAFFYVRALSVTAALACSATCETAPVPEERDAVELEMEAEAAVLRHLFRTSGVDDMGFFCVSRGTFTTASDPSDQLLSKFFDHIPKVVAGSACEGSRNGDLHRASGESAQLFFLETTERTDAGLFKIAARHHVHGRQGATFDCTVRSEDSGWDVECRTVSIS